jgi:transitional endoplasmic reticulum ATPase
MVTERVVSQLLTELDGIQELQDVIVLAATNRIDMVDPALLRAGRFDKLIYVPLPDRAARKQILEIHFKGKPLSPEVSIDKIADATDGFSGADLAAIANTAVSLLVQEYVSKYPTPEEAKKHLEEAVITQRHVDQAINRVKATKEGRLPEKEIKPYYR